MKPRCMPIVFFNLNIKHNEFSFASDKSAAEHWLDDRSKAPVFYGPQTAAEILSGKTLDLRPRAQNELMRFLQIREEADQRRIRPVIVTIDSGYVWLYELVGQVQSGEAVHFTRDGKPAWDLPKLYDISLVVPRRNASSVPLVLASMKTNQAFSRGTFVEIPSSTTHERNKRSYDGNIAALYSVMGCWPEGFSIDPLKALSSVELETLVAKIFEELGCFVPAYRGGVLAISDLYIYPPAAGVELQSNIWYRNALSLQIKLHIESRGDWQEQRNWTNRSPDNVLLTLQRQHSLPKGLQFRPGSLLTREWLDESLRRCPRTAEWLTRSLEWLPAERRAVE